MMPERHYHRPLCYPCPRFRFFAASIVELAHGENSRTQSLSQSLTQLIFDALNRSLLFGKKVSKNNQKIVKELVVVVRT